MNERARHAPDRDELPFAAPCRSLTASEPIEWLRLGWADLKSAPRQSLSYGVLMLALSHALTAATWLFGNLGLYLGLVSGFVFVGPWLALTLYSISRRLEQGKRVSLGGSVRDAARAVGNALVFAVILTVVFLVWARAATMVHVFFPALQDPGWTDLLPFLAVGTAVGAVFSAIVFAASAFSLPMLLDRRTDTVTAVVTSINAVLRNKAAMVVWAAIIVGCVIIGAATAWLAFVVLLPLIGHATWHAYRRAIDAGQWPRLD
ncbi:DUF2189 domain-containing protein [Wenzhouxiangella sp. XN201]|uniref:DUF2189 domain-containing protein n=1 Tax=Wenzhouxiangella sp. XN201 TaxID=2710755 RepID=UPI0013C70A7C|nr:DUF2189 domain-containing protein [Wenzhouxiangella sp. XN201]NEZ04196.1 DUF2189 domain-containing protein [Wenzhouxiangella sp. XN201]